MKWTYEREHERERERKFSDEREWGKVWFTNTMIIAKAVTTT